MIYPSIDKILNTIDPIKDVDGLTKENMGKLLSNKEGTIPCTPKGIIKILESNNVVLEGKHVVIVGRSNLVGKPIAIECLKRNATVTVCHSHTKDLNPHLSNADIVITATGRPLLINSVNIHYIKKGAIIIDVGISRGYDGKLCGDVSKELYEDKYRLFTPVPKGMGLYTRLALMQNLSNTVR